jgi:hypothetical protein
MAMALSVAEIAVSESPIADDAAPRTELAQAISNRVASYSGPIDTPVGKELWAIQAWYAQLGEELRAEELLAARC